MARPLRARRRSPGTGNGEPGAGPPVALLARLSQNGPAVDTFSADERRLLLTVLAGILAVTGVVLFHPAWKDRLALPEPVRDAAASSAVPRPDPNTATLEDLIAVEGIDRPFAEAILSHRRHHLIVDLYDLASVPGAEHVDLRALGTRLVFPSPPPGQGRPGGPRS